ncbi:MAG TPA: hypothetical protein VGR66_01180 [Candidatus Eisenbacteria bacterium]|nr:hypothetical protein [Candidatus Eisenbacteria bacterium]
MRRNQRHVLMAALLVSVLALSGVAFADGDSNQPYPKPAGVSTYSEVDGVVGMLLNSASYIVDLL